MLDKYVIPAFEKALTPLGASFAKSGFKSEHLIVASFAGALVAGGLAGTGFFMAGLGVFLLARLLDGLAEALGREAGITAFGRYLDLFLTLTGFAAIGLAFGFLGEGNELIAAILVFSLLAWGGSTLAYAGVARGLKIKTDASPDPRLDFFAGLVGTTELTLGFVLMFLFPNFFPAIAAILAALILLITGARVLKAAKVFWK